MTVYEDIQKITEGGYHRRYGLRDLAGRKRGCYEQGQHQRNGDCGVGGSGGVVHTGADGQERHGNGVEEMVSGSGTSSKFSSW